MQIKINQLKDTQNLAEKIASLCDKNDVICLQGDLGAGKTTFSQFFINYFSKEKLQVQSPTFNIVFPYEFGKFKINHFDLYRLKSQDELEEIGFYDSLDYDISIIEWPEIASESMPKDRLEIAIKTDKDGQKLASLSGFGTWNDKLNEL